MHGNYSPAKTARKALNKTRPNWTMINRDILSEPPICHRDTDPALNYLAPFAFKLGIGVLGIATLQQGEADHIAAMQKGAEKMQAELALAEDYKQEWVEENARRKHGEPPVTPLRMHTFDPPGRLRTKPVPLKQALRRAAKKGYDDEMKARRLNPPKQITIVTSTNAILRAARLSDDRNNWSGLEAALDRLCAPVGPECLLRPLLKSWKRLPNGKLELCVTTVWSKPPWVKVRLPLPVRSPATLALYLLLHHIGLLGEGNNDNNRKMAADKLCQRLGISLKWGRVVTTRAIEQTLKHLNQHLASQGRAIRFQLLSIGDGHCVQFVSNAENIDGDDEQAGQEAEPIVKPKVERLHKLKPRQSALYGEHDKEFEWLLAEYNKHPDAIKKLFKFKDRVEPMLASAADAQLEK